MKMFLATLSLDDVNKGLFINRAKKEGSNVNALIEEAKTLNETKRVERIQKKRDEFRKVLEKNNKLSATDRSFLIGEVDEKTTLNSLRKRVEKYISLKANEKKNMVQQNLLSFLTPLKINQTNKNEFMRRFRNNGANVNAIKTEALKLQNTKMSANVEALRTRLTNRLTQIGLNQVNKNTFIKRFTNGNRNVDELIQQAKDLKKTRNSEKFNKNKREYSAFLNTLSNLSNADKISLKLNGNMNREKATKLDERRRVEKKRVERNGLVNHVSKLGLNTADTNTILTEYDANKLTVNAIKNKAKQLKNRRVGEKKVVNRDSLVEYLKTTTLSGDVKNNILKKFNQDLANLTALKSEVNQLVKNITDSETARNKKNFTNYVKTTILSQRDQNAFIRRLNVSNTNIPALRREVDAMVAKMVSNQRSKNRDELEEYMKTSGVSNQNRIMILSKFNANDKIAIENLKMEAMKVLETGRQEKLRKNKLNLKTHMNQLTLSETNKQSLLNRVGKESLNSLKLEANRISQQRKTNTKAQKRQKPR
jgi:hypothetical protein